MRAKTHTNPSPPSLFLPTFPEHKMLRRLAVDVLSTRPRVWGMSRGRPQHWLSAHSLQRSRVSHLEVRARRVPRAGGPPGSRAAPRTVHGTPVTRPPSCPLLARPHGAHASPGGGAAVALSFSAEAHLLSFPPRPDVPGLQCGPARSLCFLQTPRRTLPPLPPPALGLQVNEMLVFLSHLFCFPAKF